MAKRKLTLVREAGLESARVGRALCGLVAGSMALAWVATLPWNVSESRRLPDAREQATEAVRLSMERGSDDAEALRLAAALRERIRLAPLDSRTRSVYSAVLLALSRSLEQTRAAAFHAELAAELAPVTTSVVRRSTRVLFGTGDFEAAREWNRRLFEFDPSAGASMLISLEPGLTEQEVDLAIPDTDAAWLAWSKQLRDAGRELEADRWADRTFDRWPESDVALRTAAAGAVRNRDWERLAQIFSKVEEFPDEVRSAIPLVYRAQLRLHQGRQDEALADLQRAEVLGPKIDLVWTHAGDLYTDLDQLDRARSAWTRALHLVGTEPSPRRANLLGRLARLEQRHGQASRAIRHWEEILRIRPEDPEASRELRNLQGG